MSPTRILAAILLVFLVVTVVWLGLERVGPFGLLAAFGIAGVFGVLQWAVASPVYVHTYSNGAVRHIYEDGTVVDWNPDGQLVSYESADQPTK